MSKVCFGCGSILQCDNELNVGFIPKEKLDTANYCKRCFRLTHYGEISNCDIEKSTKYIIDTVNKSSDFKIFIVDFLNINNNTINIYNKIKGNKLLLVSKIDLLGRSVNIDRIVSNIKSIYSIDGDIKTISSLKENGVNSLIKYLESKNISKCFLLGPSNSGKSTLINKLISIYNSSLNKLTISNKRNTTLEFIRIKINDKLVLIDSPGFLISDYGKVSKYKNIIKPITFNMKGNEVLFIDKFYIKFSSDSSVTIYVNDQVEVKKYYKSLEYDYDTFVDSNVDLCINGFGIINIKSSNNISVKSLDKNLISIRKSVFGDIYE